MQSYEEAGGYGLPAYYDMGMAAAAGGFGGAGGFMGSPLNALAARQAFGGFAGMGMGAGMGAGMGGLGGAGARGRGAMMRRGGMRGGRGGMAGLGMGGMGVMGRGGGAAGGRGGGKMMRGRGGAGPQRFNPLSGKKKSDDNGETVPGHIVFCYNIGQNTGEEDVRELFSLYGTVGKVDVIWDFAKNITKGYAFVTMPDYDEAAYAIEQLNGYNYSGKPLQVSFKSDKNKK